MKFFKNFKGQILNYYYNYCLISESASKQKKLTVHKAKQYLQEQTDPVEENVEKLLQLSNTKTRKEVTHKVKYNILKIAKRNGE